MGLDDGDNAVGVVGHFRLSRDLHLSAAAMSLLAYLAIHGPTVERSFMSMQLWPDVDASRARANLRHAIWRTPAGWVRSSTREVMLRAETDIARARTLADRALDGAALDADELELLSHDLLPSWDETWLVEAQQLFHLRRVQALESAAHTLSSLGCHALATRAALAAVCAEPLRNSAVLALVGAHVNEGNVNEAVRRFEDHRVLLWQELQTEPSDELTDLMQQTSVPERRWMHGSAARRG